MPRNLLIAGLAFLTTSLGLLAGSTSIFLADFGGPRWAFLCLWGWLVTLGLPTTATVVLTAAFWGRLPGLFGLVRFLAVAATLSWLVNYVLLRRMLRPWSARP